MKKTINGKEYELVKTDINGCINCAFLDDDESCVKSGDYCMRAVHGNNYSMIWKEVEEDPTNKVII